MMRLLTKLFERKPQFGRTAEMPIPPERLRSLTSQDQFLASYPRSGNTWTRFLIHDLLVQSRRELPAPEERGSLVPDVHRHDITSTALASYGLKGRILKSHNLRDLRGRRVLYLVRDPADTLVSYYHFHLRYDHLQAQAAEGPDAFCRVALSDWMGHVQLALAYREADPDSVMFVRYEDLLADTIGQLGRIAGFFGISTTPESVQVTIEKNAFERLREQEEKKPLNPAANPKEFFFRQGCSGTGQHELSKDVVDFIHQETAGICGGIRRAAGANVPDPTT